MNIKKTGAIIGFLLAAATSNAQLKIGNNPGTISAGSLLEMESTNKGLVLPRVSITALTSADPLDADLLDGTIVYNTNTALSGGVGIYVWRSTLGSWQQLVVSASMGTTLNGAYNFGGAGSGRTITANAGSLRIAGTDGLLVTGTYNSGTSVELGGAGTRLFFNPRKAAFRAGSVDGSQWDNANVGDNSIAMGNSSQASGGNAVAIGASARATANDAVSLGANNLASGVYSMAMGYSSTASGDNATTTGYSNQAIGANSFAMGHTSIARGQSAMASGHYVQAKGYGAAALGAFNDITDAPNGGTAAPADRIFQVGNGSADNARSNAVTVLRSGNVGIGELAPQQRLVVNGQVKITGGNPGSGKVLTSDADGVASWQTPAAGGGGGTLDQAYDYGGAGSGRTITADAGAMKIAGTDGLLIIGTYNSGADIETSGAGTRMFFNPKKGAFRAGYIGGSQWDNANVGTQSIAFGQNTIASGSYSTAVGTGTSATSYASFAAGGNTVASGPQSFAMGWASIASGASSVVMGNLDTASNTSSIALGEANHASGYISFAAGFKSVASGNYAVALGQNNIALGGNSFVAGQSSVTLGTGSIAMGQSARAEQGNSFAVGNYARASGTHAIAMGDQALSSGIGSVSIGSYNSRATGNYAISMGSNAVSSGTYSTSIGSYNSQATADYAIAMGHNSTASSLYSAVIGPETNASANYAVAIGSYLTSKSYGGTVIGRLNDNSDNPSSTTPAATDRIFQIGNGTSGRSNAMTVLRNGNTGIGVLAPTTHKLEVDGRIRQKFESQLVTVPANGGTNFTWTHNLGYNPIIMISLDHTGGSGYLDYCSFSYGHDDTNTLRIYLTNRGSNAASGTVRWIVVY